MQFRHLPGVLELRTHDIPEIWWDIKVIVDIAY